MTLKAVLLGDGHVPDKETVEEEVKSSQTQGVNWEDSWVGGLWGTCWIRLKDGGFR